jgi:hypothetical protein
LARSVILAGWAAEQGREMDFDTGVFPPQWFRCSIPPSYNLVSLYAGYQMTPDVLVAFSAENLLNENYMKYMCGSTQAAMLCRTQA